MRRRFAWGASIFAVLLTCCGGSEACSEEDDVANQIQMAAAQDHISTASLCVKPQTELEAQVGHDRALLYAAACQRIADLHARCNR